MAIWIKKPDAGGTCCDCQPHVCDDCTCPASTLVCDSISASKTKCGFGEFVSPSTPPKIYRTKTQSGTLTIPSTSGCVNPCEDYTNVWSGNITYARSSCSTTDTRKMTLNYTLTGAPCGGPCSGSFDQNWFADDLVGGGPDRKGNTAYGSSGCGSPAGVLFGCGGESDTQTQIDLTTSCGGCSPVSGDVKIDLSNEYTTAFLIADTEAALPSYPGTFTGTCSSFRNLTTDELSYSIRRFKYKFILPASPPAGYVIKWKEGTTDKCYAWNGVDTETPVYGPVNEPGSNGTIDINTVQYFCDGTTC